MHGNGEPAPVLKNRKQTAQTANLVDMIAEGAADAARGG